MGDVWLARPAKPKEGLPARCVVKRLLPELADSPDFVQRFEHEATVAGRIANAYVAKLLEAGQVGRTLYAVHEYVEGWTLARTLQELRKAQQLPSVASVLTFVSELLDGLEAIHSASDGRGRPLGAVHRDLSPNNIMVSESGHAKIIDLGLGKSKLQTWKTRTGAVLGSPGYMAPEQARGAAVDQRADLYSIGVVLFELLTLEPYIARGPVAAMLARSLEPAFRPVTTLRTDVPSQVDDVLRQALSVSVEGRYSSALDFHHAVRALSDDTTASPMSLVGAMISSEVERTRFEHTKLRLADRSLDGATEAPSRVITATWISNDARTVPANARALVEAPRRGPALLLAMVMAAALAVGAAFVVEVPGPSTQANESGSAELAPAAEGASPRAAASRDDLNDIATDLLARARATADRDQAIRMLESCVKLEVLPACAVELSGLEAKSAPPEHARPARPRTEPREQAGAKVERPAGPATKSVERRVERPKTAQHPFVTRPEGADLDSLRFRIDELTKRARTLRAAAKSDVALAQKVEALLSDVFVESGASSPARIAALEARLVTLQREASP